MMGGKNQETGDRNKDKRPKIKEFILPSGEGFEI